MLLQRISYVSGTYHINLTITKNSLIGNNIFYATDYTIFYAIRFIQIICNEGIRNDLKGL